METEAACAPVPARAGEHSPRELRCSPAQSTVLPPGLRPPPVSAAARTVNPPPRKPSLPSPLYLKMLLDNVGVGDFSLDAFVISDVTNADGTPLETENRCKGNNA